ncbi:MAG: hypothetical protein FD180_4052 [Planctomycetota bacterium]|nr:MAG: hypothetical protein FD180_4052 [Planctomycetota bacterium]
MRSERQLWQALEIQETDPEARTLDLLLQTIQKKSGWALMLDRDISGEKPVRAPGPDESLADALRSTAISAGLSVVPSEWNHRGYVTRSPRQAEWPQTWPLVRILRALRGEAPDATERAWLALERPATSPPAGNLSVREVATWLSETTGMSVEYSEEALVRAEDAPALRIPPPEEGDTISSCARVAFVRAGLDVAARRGAVLICLRGEADALDAGRFLTREWTEREWYQGLEQLKKLDRQPVVIHSGLYLPAVVIMHIANACNLSASMDDVTWDESTLIALPEGSYTVRELREQLWISAGIRMHALKGSIWFVEPVAQ